MAEQYFVYILASRRNGTLYTGVTNNLARWMTEHKSGLVAGFTRKYGVKLLVYFEPYSSVLEARAREHSLKRWRRAWKLQLIGEGQSNVARFNRRADVVTNLFWAPALRFAALRPAPLGRGTRVS